MGSYGYIFNPDALVLLPNHEDNDSVQNGTTILSDLYEEETYEYWGFSFTWTIVEGVSTPTLRSMPNNIDINDGSTAEPIISLNSLQLSVQAVPEKLLSAPVGDGGGGTPPPEDPDPGEPPMFEEF